MNDDDLETTSVIDLGGVGVDSTYIYKIDANPITISGIDYSTMTSTITLPTSWSATNIPHNVTSVGYNYSNPGISGSSASTVNITTDGIDMKAGTDIKIDGKSLKEFMTKMEQRLAILVPDPTKLEKFEALKKAYEHYKTMESLCFNEPEEPK